MASEHPKKILVIEDDEDIRTAVATLLSQAGYETTIASDGKDGLRRFYGDRPNRVVLDIAMPVMDGWQVLERLREVSDLPVLILTDSPGSWLPCCRWCRNDAPRAAWYGWETA